MMDRCRDWESLLTAYVDGELSAVEEQRVRAHLAVCPACARLFADLLADEEQVAAYAQTIEPPLGLEARVVAALAEEHQVVQSRRLVYVYLCCSIVGLCALVGLVVSPIGSLVTLAFHFASAVLRGLVSIPTAVHQQWLVVAAAFSMLLLGISLFGTARLLRSSRRSEVLL
ncbi:anti-sigma factor family protein [Alicyclobacillus hesperidum]|uniref:anti-sigma factor family protein n=1 Tax=Alicyclobacillus hesperidum TaxID=89784 RepID=UPI0002D29A7C|nr:zf-HC2 domain-containing protein [Alicyclobacillus hesperidum]